MRRITSMMFIFVIAILVYLPVNIEAKEKNEGDLSKVEALITEGIRIDSSGSTSSSGAFTWIAKVQKINKVYDNSFVYSRIKSATSSASHYDSIDTFNYNRKIIGYLYALRDEIKEVNVVLLDELIAEGENISSNGLSDKPEAFYWTLKVEKYSEEHSKSSQYSNLISDSNSASHYDSIDTMNFNTKIIGYLTALQYENPEVTHNYELAEVLKKATCKKTGTELYKCTRCFDSYKQTVPKKKHTIVIDKAKKPTCLKDGKTKGSHCSVCGKVIKKQEIIKAPGKHTKVHTKEKKPTYFKEGRTKGCYCEVCGKVFSGRKTIPKLELSKPKHVKVSTKRRAFVLKWKEVKEADGYQIQYSTDIDFSRQVYKRTVKKNSPTKTLVNYLEPKEWYYIRVRSYIKNSKSSSKAYSKWVYSFVKTK